MNTPTAIGPYQVVRELGRGGMGVVLEVRHPQIPKRLALKLILGDAVGGEAFARFEREAKLLARVSHPNVVAIRTLDTDRGRPYLVTDLVEGRNLKHVAREAPLAPERAARIVLALASGVAAIHEKGILHRDLKPENVILGADDSPVLLDFGLAREADARSLTQSGALVGTPAYMAPEQANGGGRDSLDARTDVYGLGTILFELLAGRPPFEGDGPVQLITAVIMKEPQWPSATRKDVPPALEALLRRALAKSREARPASAQALADELGLFLRGELPAQGPRRVGWWLAAGGIGLLLVALAGAAALTRQGAPPIPVAPPPPPPPDPKPSGPPPPPTGNGKSPAGFRKLLDWLRREDTQQDRARKGVELQRDEARKGPLARVAGPVGVLEVRFLSDRWLAVISDKGVVKGLDLSNPSSLTDLWVLPGSVESGYRAWDLAVSEPGPDGMVRVFVASHRGLWVGKLDPVKGPPAGSKLTKVWGTEEDVVKAVALAPDGETLVFDGGASSVLLREPSGQLRRIPLERCTTVQAIAFLAGGGRFLVGFGTSRSTSCLALVDPTNGAATTYADYNGDIHGLAVASHRPGEEIVGLASGLSLHMAPAGLTDLGALHASPWVKAAVAPTFGGLAFGKAPQGGQAPALYAITRPIGDVDASLTVWNPGAIEEPFRQVSTGKTIADSMAVSPDGALVAVAGREGTTQSIQIWAGGD